MKYCLLILLCALVGCTSSPEFYSEDHDFAAASLQQEKRTSKNRAIEARPNLDALLGAAQKRFSADREIDGLLDVATKAALSEYAWLQHPQLNALRDDLRASLDEFGQARELEDLLATYRAFESPGRGEKFIIAPHMESLRGAMADKRAEATWFKLREGIVHLAAKIFERQANVTFLTEQIRVTSAHLALIDDLIPVVRSRTTAGRSRQAEILAFRSERAAVAAKIEALKESSSAAMVELSESLNSVVTKPVLLPNRSEGSVSEQALSKEALTSEPKLAAMKAMLERRKLALRMVELVASERPTMPGGGVRASMRRELRNKIAAAEDLVRNRELTIASNVAQARARYVGAQSRQTALAEKSIPDARKALNSLRSSYGGRQATFLDVFRAARRLLNLELELAQARRDITKADAALMRAVGKRIK